MSKGFKKAKIAASVLDARAQAEFMKVAERWSRQAAPDSHNSGVSLDREPLQSAKIGSLPQPSKKRTMRGARAKRYRKPADAGQSRERKQQAHTTTRETSVYRKRESKTIERPGAMKSPSPVGRPSKFRIQQLKSIALGSSALRGRVEMGSMSLVMSALSMSNIVQVSGQMLHHHSPFVSLKDVAASVSIKHDEVQRSVMRHVIARMQYKQSAQLFGAPRKSGARAERRKTMLRVSSISRIASLAFSRKLLPDNIRMAHVVSSSGNTVVIQQFDCAVHKVGTRRASSGVEASSMPRQAVRAEARSMVMSAMQMQLGNNSIARAGAPLSAPRISALSNQRTSAHMMPIFGNHSPLDTLRDKLLNPGIPDNQDLYSLADIIDRARAEKIMSCIIEQLGRGPEALEKTDLLDKVNAALPESFEQLDTEGWHAVLQETLMIAIQQIKVFDDGGLRKLKTIHADAAVLLDLDADEFAVWETHFCISALADNLIEHDDVAGAVEDDLIQLIRQQVIERACNAFERGDYRDALLYSFETRIQWAVARHSSIEESDEKISSTAAFISETAKKNRIAVSRFLALVVRHSRLSRDKIRRTHPLIPHWRTGEVRKLIALVMEEMPSVMSDSCLRTQLTEREKMALNKAIIKANYENIMITLSKMSSDRPIEDFLDAIAESDEGGKVLLDIVLTMARNRENQDVN